MARTEMMLFGWDLTSITYKFTQQYVISCIQAIKIIDLKFFCNISRIDLGNCDCEKSKQTDAI